MAAPTENNSNVFKIYSLVQLDQKQYRCTENQIIIYIRVNVTPQTNIVFLCLKMFFFGDIIGINIVDVTVS